MQRDGTAFHTDLQIKLDEGSKFCQHLKETFARNLDAHPPIKTSVLRDNHKPHVGKSLYEAIIKRSTLKASKMEQQEAITKYKKLLNSVLKVNREPNFNILII